MTSKISGTTTTSSRFEDQLADMMDRDDAKEWVEPVAEVCDVAALVLIWMDEHLDEKHRYPCDMIELTRMILDRKRDHETARPLRQEENARQKAAEWLVCKQDQPKEQSWKPVEFPKT